MELLCLTGVEDKLQVTLVCYREDLTLFVLGYELYVRMLSIVKISFLRNRENLVSVMLLFLFFQADVRPTLELLRNAGVKVSTKYSDMKTSVKKS